MKPVKLEDIAIALDTNFDESGYYLNTETGETTILEDRIFRFADEHQETLGDPDAQDEVIERLMEEEHLSFWSNDWDVERLRDLAKMVNDTLVCIEPLSSHEQYEIMEDFIETEDDEKIRGLLSIAIEGRGAFRRFKDSLGTIGRLQDYYDYHDRVMKEKAREWCEDEGIPFTE